MAKANLKQDKQETAKEKFDKIKQEKRLELQNISTDEINDFLLDFNITFDEKSKEISEKMLKEKCNLQIKNLKGIKGFGYKQVTLPIKEKPTVIQKENLVTVAYKFYRNYYLDKNFVFGQIFSQDNELWFPRKNFGNKNYLSSFRGQENKGTSVQVAIFRDLHNLSLSMLWNYFDYFDDQ